MNFDVQRLVSDLGGATKVSSQLNITRTIPYGWIRRRYISSTYLARLKEVNKSLDLNQYVTGENTNGDAKRSA